MEFFSTSFLSALLAIVVIDLVLAGDNAIVIGLAARSLPQHLQKKAILWGALGAVVIRALMTLAVVWLLKIPGLLLLGGGALLWIATKLTAEQAEDSQSAVMDSPQAPTAVGFRQAIQTIIMADVVMGVDNVLAIAGAA
ncbi:MAG: YjbE family putative metal transport protein, partial [Betaproteobacteria bacterium]|nr:YjbE family putative metal transport protein [Betaproteobacteria bacterium]